MTGWPSLGGELLVQVVADIAAGTAQRTPQDPDQVTFAPMLSRALSPIDWTQSGQAIHDKVRGLDALARHIHGYSDGRAGKGLCRPG